MNSNSPRKIMILNSSPSKTGIGRYSDDLVSLFPDQITGYSLVLDSARVNESYPGIKINGYFPPLFTNGWFLNLNYQRFIFRKVRRQARILLRDGGIVHITDPSVEPINYKGKQVATIHDLFALYPDNSPLRAERKHFAKVVEKYKMLEFIITTTDRVKRELLEHNFSSEITRIYPGTSKWFHKMKTSKDDLRKELGLPLKNNLVLSVSNDRYRKNIDMIPKIMNNLGESYRLVRVGKSIGNDFSFQGISNETLNKIYNACDVLIQPSLDEGFGYPIPEAMATALPIVCSDIEIFREIAADCAYLSSIDPQSFAEGIRAVIEQKETYSKKAYSIASRFSMDRFQDEIGKFYSYLQGQDISTGSHG